MKGRIILSLIFATLPNAVQAEVLTEDNGTVLCTRTYQGRPAVDPDTLAMLIVAKAEAAMLLDGANRGGVRDGSIQLISRGGTLGEPAYAVLNAGKVSPASANRPFGPNVDLTSNKAAAAASAKIAGEVAELAFLTDDDVHPAGAVTYRVLRPATVGSRLDRAEAANPLNLFADASLVIACESDAVTTTSTGIGQSPPVQPASPSRLAARPVLRGTVKDLSIASSDLKDAEAATIGYSEDKIADATTFELDAVAGVRIGSRTGSFELIPYLSYERKAITGDDGDIEVVSPGILAAWRFERPYFGFHARLEASYIDDIEQGSHQGKIRVYVDPAIWLGPNAGTLFGGNLPVFSPLLLRPKLTLIADVSKIYRAGTNADLADAKDYWGIGADLSLRALLDVGSPISDFVIAGGVRHLELQGPIQLNHARRWYGSLEYAPSAYPYVALALEYNDGRNDDTFQQEDTYGLSLRLRY